MTNKCATQEVQQAAKLIAAALCKLNLTKKTAEQDAADADLTQDPCLVENLADLTKKVELLYGELLAF